MVGPPAGGGPDCPAGSEGRPWPACWSARRWRCCPASGAAQKGSRTRVSSRPAGPPTATHRLGHVCRTGALAIPASIRRRSSCSVRRARWWSTSTPASASRCRTPWTGPAAARHCCSVVLSSPAPAPLPPPTGWFWRSTPMARWSRSATDLESSARRLTPYGWSAAETPVVPSRGSAWMARCALSHVRCRGRWTYRARPRAAGSWWLPLAERAWPAGGVGSRRWSGGADPLPCGHRAQQRRSPRRVVGLLTAMPAGGHQPRRRLDALPRTAAGRAGHRRPAAAVAGRPTLRRADAAWRRPRGRPGHRPPSRHAASRHGEHTAAGTGDRTRSAATAELCAVRLVVRLHG
jgi:hypothetical protein